MTDRRKTFIFVAWEDFGKSLGRAWEDGPLPNRSQFFIWSEVGDTRTPFGLSGRAAAYNYY